MNFKSLHRLVKSPLALMAAGLVGIVAVACSTSVAAAPSFSGETFHHGTFDLDEQKGKPVVINFWFPSCPPCVAEMPDLQEAYEKYGPQGVEFVGVQQLGLDTPQDGIEFLEERGVTFPAFPDTGSQVQSSYEILSFPTTIFLNRDHSINRTWTGLISKDHLEEQVEEILNS